MKIGSFCVVVFYDNGDVDAHITNSEEIKSADKLESNIRTTSIIKDIQTNPRFNEIKYIYVFCKKYRA